MHRVIYFLWITNDSSAPFYPAIEWSTLQSESYTKVQIYAFRFRLVDKKTRCENIEPGFECHLNSNLYFIALKTLLWLLTGYFFSFLFRFVIADSGYVRILLSYARTTLSELILFPLWLMKMSAYIQPLCIFTYLYLNS